MSKRSHMRVRSSIQKRAPASSRKAAWIPYEGDPYAAYPNWEAFFFSSRYGASASEGDFGRDDWGRSEAYKLVGIVNRCIDVIANTVNSIPWNIVRKRGKEKEVVSSSEEQSPTHPLAQAINAVYKEQGIAFMKLLIYSRLQFGETYVEKVQNMYGGRRRMVYLNPYWTEPDTGTGKITLFRYGAKNGQAQEILYPPQVAYEHTYNPTDNLRGLPKLDAAMFDVNTSRGLKRFIKWTLDNNARPGLIASPKQDPNLTPLVGDKQADMLESVLSDSHVGPRNANRAIVLKSPFDITTLEGPELDKYRGLIQEFKKEICTVFGVPMSMAGDSSATSYKDGEDVYDDAYINNTIKPHVKDNQDFINVHLMPFFDGTGECVLEYDLSAYEDTTEGDRAKADLIAVQQDKGWVTLADAQRAQGLPVYAEYEGKVMINGVITPLAQIGQMTQQPQPMLAPDITITEPSLPQLPARTDNSTPAPDATKDVQSVSVVLSFAGNVDLVKLQQDLRADFQGQDVTWSDPSTLHLTLISAMADDALVKQLAAQINDYAPPEMSLNIGSFAAFDKLGKHALHFRIRSNKDLEAYQKDLFVLCEDLGIQTVQYSQPASWKPHITVGYSTQRVPAVTFRSGLRVSPAEVHVSVKRDDSYEVIARVACGSTEGQEPAPSITPEQFDKAKHAPAYVFESHLPVEEWRTKALQELTACQTRAKKGRKFQLDLTKHFTGDLDLSTLTQETYRPAFDHLFSAVRYEPFEKTKKLFKDFMAQKGTLTDEQIKAWTETRDAFSDEVLLAIADAADGSITESAFEAAMNGFIAEMGEEAYRDGLADAGADPMQLDDDDYDTINTLIAKQRDYVFFLADRIYTDGISAEQEAIKPDLWVNKTLVPFYQAGLAAGTANGTFEWVLGDTEHCTDCLARGGQIKPMKTWLNDGILPQSSELECGGWRCGCKLRPVRLRPRR